MRSRKDVADLLEFGVFDECRVEEDEHLPPIEVFLNQQGELQVQQ